MKKILKYISLSIGIVIFIWLTYGFYLYLNLPDIRIENNKTKTTFSSRADKSNLPINIDAKLIVKSLLPSNKLFKNNQRYSFLFPQLFAMSVVIFENIFTPQYSFCIDKLNYIIPIKTGVLTDMRVLGDFLGFKYHINHKELTHGTKEIQDIYPELGRQKNFPLVGKLIKGDSCNKNIIFKYNLELSHKDSINKEEGRNYPFDIYNREFTFKITSK
jgi:hypothetical protein